jgi:predicted small metal-binding protein
MSAGGKMPTSEREHQEKVGFRCSDVGPKNCEWQISGNSEAEIMPKIEQHGREKYNMKIDDDTRKKVHSAIHTKAARSMASLKGRLSVALFLLVGGAV